MRLSTIHAVFRNTLSDCVPPLHPLVAATTRCLPEPVHNIRFTELRVIRRNERALDYLYSVVPRSGIGHNLPWIISGRRALP